MHEEQGGGDVFLRALTRMCTAWLKCGCMESVHTITLPASQATAPPLSQLCSLSCPLSEVRCAWKHGNAER